MGRWRRKLGVVLGVLTAGLFVASTLICNFANAVNAANLYATYDLAVGSTANNVVPDYFLPSDVVIEQIDINFYAACSNYKGETEYADTRYSLTINNNPTFNGEPLLQCLKHAKGKDDGRRVFEDGNLYSIGIKQKYGSGKKAKKFIDSTSHDYSGSFNNVSIDILSQNAAHDRANKNKRYDVLFHFTNIHIVTGTVNKVKTDRDDTDTGLAILYGFKGGKSWFSAGQYVGHKHFATGVKFDVAIELIDLDATTEAGRKPRKTMIWMLSDIDIAQRLKDEDASKESKRTRCTYSSSCTYAEHVKLISGGVKISEDEKFQAKNAESWNSQPANSIPVTMVPGRNHATAPDHVGDKELGIASDGAIYHRHMTPSKTNYVESGKYSGNVKNNSTDAIFKIKVNDASDPFKFEWGGSGCATMIASAPYKEDDNPPPPDSDPYYNYELKPYVTNMSTKAAYIGSSITMDPGVVVAVRRDTLLDDDDDLNTYATGTKETEVKVSYWFTNSAGSLKGSVQEAYETVTRRFNDENGIFDRSPDSVEEELDDVTIDIGENLSVGDRVCVEVSVYPFDSHDGTNNIPVSYKETSDISTRRATASCLPVAKRPIMSVESSNVYSATNIYTLTYRKNINDVRYYFGSWSEYGVFGRVNSSTLMASGAALGYNRDGYTGDRALNVSRGNPGEGNKVATDNNSGDCTFMTQTFANAECKQGENGQSIGGVTAEQFRDRMTDRYQDSSSTAITGLSQKQFGNIQYMDVSNINPTAETFYNAKLGFTSVKGNNLYLSQTPTYGNGDRSYNHTVVYHATNLVIDGDINKETTKALGALSDITGVVIFAERVYLTDRVNYVNATIIADEVNTCAFQAANPGVKLKLSNLSSNICNKSVIFDQPVVTKRLVLNRTAGANSGADSIVRAEVFNLNSGNYLWSYGQMSRYSQAITSFSRELSPRY